MKKDSFLIKYKDFYIKLSAHINKLNII